MVKLSRTGEKTVYFLEGHNERPRWRARTRRTREGYVRAAEALRNENYARQERCSSRPSGDVPDDADAVVVIAGATRPLPRSRSTRRWSATSPAAAPSWCWSIPRANTDLVEERAGLGRRSSART